MPFSYFDPCLVKFLVAHLISRLNPYICTVHIGLLQLFSEICKVWHAMNVVKHSIHDYAKDGGVGTFYQDALRSSIEFL